LFGKTQSTLRKGEARFFNGLTVSHPREFSMGKKYRGILFLFCAVIFFFFSQSSGNAEPLAKADTSIDAKLASLVLYFLDNDDDIFDEIPIEDLVSDDIISDDVISDDVVSDDVVSDDKEPSELDILNEQGCNSLFDSAWIVFVWGMSIFVFSKGS
jgi:hypothetical protein